MIGAGTSPGSSASFLCSVVTLLLPWQEWMSALSRGAQQSFKWRAAALRRWRAWRSDVAAFVSSPSFYYFFSPPPLFFPAGGPQTEKKRVSACSSFFSFIYQLVYLRSMQYPQAREHTTVHCPRLIDKTCSSVCCTHWHFSSQQSTLSLSACVWSPHVVRPARPAVDTVNFPLTLVAFLFLLRRLFLPHHALVIETRGRGRINPFESSRTRWDLQRRK